MALTDNILAYWKLDNNGSGGVSLVDSTGNSNTLTNNGGVPLGGGIINNGAVFTETAKYLSTPSGLFPLTDQRTYSGWVRFNNTPTGYQFVFVQGGTSDFQAVSPLYIESDGTVSSIFTTSNGSWTNFLFTSIVPSANTWHHFTTTFDGSVAKLYWNGSEVGTSEYTGSILAPDNDFFALGFYPAFGELGLDGNIDEVGIWNRALSAAEVTELYNVGAGISYPFASLYFNAAVDGNLATLGNWWQDSGFTTPADALPDNSNLVFITAPVTSGTATYASALITANIGSAVSITANTITLNSGINSGTLIGPVVLNNSSSNAGTITGNATLNGSSSNAGTITGDATIYNPSANPIGGVVTGSETYLWPNGTGLWGGDVWINGDIAFIIPEPSDVRSGVEYGPASDPYVGTYSGGGGAKKRFQSRNF
jgi:hypothetical protein